MSCERWNDEWVAQLYGELPESEESSLREHLAACPACRATMDRLRESRTLLRDACPEVPSRPAVLVLRPTPRFRPFWAWAASAACAVLVFAAGLATGRLVPGTAGENSTVAQQTGEATPGGALPASSDGATRGDLADEIHALTARLDAIEREPRTPAAADAATGEETPWLTKAEFLQAMDRHERRADLKRTRDYEFVLSQIAAAEWRTGTQIDRTREALNWVALRSDPRVKER